MAEPPTNLLQLTDLVVEVVDAPLVLQAELREQICTELGLQRLPGGLHGVQAGLQTLETALLERKSQTLVDRTPGRVQLTTLLS